MATATGEAGVPAVEPPAAAEEQPKVTDQKPVKEKKTKQTKAKTAEHPPYFQMIKEALLALNEKNGSSPYAIAKYMEENHKSKLPANFRKILGLQLKNSATQGKLIKIKASYKLSDSSKNAEESKPTTRTRSSTRSSAKKIEVAATTPPKKSAKKKAKRSAAAKPKQLKSIKSSPSKKAKKAAVANA